MFRLLLALMTVAALVAPARADFIFDSLPAVYTPGQPFAVSVGLGPVSNLGLYNLGLVLQTTGFASDTLVISPVSPAATRYVFPTAAFFLSTPNTVGTGYRLTVSDFTLDNPGPNVVAGLNDSIATFTVMPLVTVAGPIRLSIDAGFSFLDDADGNPLPLGTSQSFVIEQASDAPLPAVPAPPGLVCAFVGVIALVARQRLAGSARKLL